MVINQAVFWPHLTLGVVIWQTYFVTSASEIASCLLMGCCDRSSNSCASLYLLLWPCRTSSLLSVQISQWAYKLRVMGWACNMIHAIFLHQIGKHLCCIARSIVWYWSVMPSFFLRRSIWNDLPHVVLSLSWDCAQQEICLCSLLLTSRIHLQNKTHL